MHKDEILLEAPVDVRWSPAHLLETSYEVGRLGAGGKSASVGRRKILGE